MSENAIALENARPGTASWRLTSPATDREVEGYASLTSVDRGGSTQIDFFVSTQIEEDFTYEVFRMGWYGGAGARLHLGPVTLQGFPQPVPPRDPNFGTFDCDWQPSFQLTGSTTASWVSGVYLVRLTGLLSGKQSYVMFVLRDDASRSDYLFQSSVFTFQAYNPWPGPPSGMSLYAPGGIELTGLAALKVSFNRPYGVTNLGSAFSLGQPYNVNAVMGIGAGEFLTNLSSDRFTMAGGWEYNLVRFLEREGYDVSYVTNFDVHTLGPEVLLRHRALLSVGHDEYWTWEMRDAVESARDQGLSIGFFSSNTCYWQARLEPSRGEENRILVVYKNDQCPERVDFITGDGDLFLPAERRTHLWTSVGRPEARLVGVGTFTAPSAGPESFYSADLVVFDPASFVFADTGLSAGDTLRGLVGMETESIRNSSPLGISRVAHSPTANGAPSDMVVYTSGSGSTVFSTDSMQWSWGLDDLDVSGTRPAFASDTARLITRNVLERLRTGDNHVDSFNTYGGVLPKDLDPNRWVVGAVCEGPPSPGVTAQQDVNSLLLTPTPDLGGFHFNGIVSTRPWNLAGKQVRVCALDTGSGEMDAFFAVTKDHENWYRIIREEALLYFQANVNGTRTWLSEAYSSGEDLWWQMRHNPATSSLLYETSADGVAWRYRWEFPDPDGLGDAYVELQAGTMTAAPNPGVARFHSLAVEPTRPWQDADGFDDDFAAHARDEDRWRIATLSVGELEGAAWVAQGGTMEIRPPARAKRPLNADATTFLDDPNYSGYVTRASVSFVHMAVSVEVIEASGGPHGVTFFGIGIDKDNWSRFLVTDGTLFLELTVAGQATVRELAYDPSAQRWWRLAHRPPSLAFETSGDGISWVSAANFDQPTWLGREVRIELQAGSERSDDAPTPATFGPFRLGHA